MATDLNEAIAAQQRGKDIAEGKNSGFTDGDVFRASSDRPLPWWVGIDATADGIATYTPGLWTGEQAREFLTNGLGGDVVMRKVMVVGGKSIPFKRATVREQSGEVMGVVGPNYQVVQDSALVDLGDAIVADNETAKYETVGSLRGGRTVVVSIELDDLHVNVKGEREEGEVRTYLLLTNTHDGSRAMEAIITPVRWVCRNTLNFAFAHKRGHFKLRHSGSVEGKLMAARDALGLTVDYMRDFEAIANKLAATEVDDDVAKKIILKVFPQRDDLTEGRVDKHPSTLAYEDYLRSPNLDPIRGTGWAVVNAVAEFVDHETGYNARTPKEGRAHGVLRSTGDVRAEAILWGRGQSAKQRALDVTLAVAKKGVAALA